MNLNTHPIHEINKRATHILFQEIGIVDTFKFINQFTLGTGDYTQERKEWLDDLKLEDILSDIKKNRR